MVITVRNAKALFPEKKSENRDTIVILVRFGAILGSKRGPKMVPKNDRKSSSNLDRLLDPILGSILTQFQAQFLALLRAQKLLNCVWTLFFAVFCSILN